MPTDPATPEKEINRLRDLKSGARDMFMMDPRIIMITGNENPRDYDLPENREHVDKLKVSIKILGVQQPLWVRFCPVLKCAILMDGECRLRASLELIAEGFDIKAVPVIQKDSGDEASRLIMSLTANTGKPLSKWEDGSAFKKLHNFGHEIADISEKTGHPERYIKESMELADAPQEVKKMLSEGSVTPGLALQTLRKKGGEGAATDLAEKVATAKERAVSGAKKPAKAKRARIATGVKFSDDDAVTVRDSLSWALDLIAKNLTPEISIRFNRCVDVLKLFPADLKASPKIDADSGPSLFDPKPDAEPETLVVDGTNAPATPAKKVARK